MQENSSRQSGLLTPVALCWIIDPNVSKELCRRWVHALAHKNARTCPLIALLFSGKVAARVLRKKKRIFLSHHCSDVACNLSQQPQKEKKRSAYLERVSPSTLPMLSDQMQIAKGGSRHLNLFLSRDSFASSLLTSTEAIASSPPLP